MQLFLHSGGTAGLAPPPFPSNESGFIRADWCVEARQEVSALSGEGREGSFKVLWICSRFDPLILRQPRKEKVGCNCHLVPSQPCKRNQTLKTQNPNKYFFKDWAADSFCSCAPSFGQVEVLSQQAIAPFPF